MMGCQIIHADKTAQKAVERQSVDQASLTAPSITHVAAAVAAIPNKTEHFPDRDDYIRMGYAIKAACGPDNETDAFEIFAGWAERWEDGVNSLDTIEADFGRMHPPYELGWDWLADKAATFGYKREVDEFDVADFSDDDFGMVASAGETPIEYSDIALAQRVARLHVSDIRYVVGGMGWVAWDGNKWALDVAKKHLSIVRRVCAQASAEALQNIDSPQKGERIAQRVASYNVIANVAKLAAVEPSMQATTEQLDADIYILNTRSGMVDLKTGTLLPHDRFSHVHKMHIGRGRLQQASPAMAGVS